MKHPTLLRNELYFTELIVWNAHKRVLHRGVNNALNFIGNDYWLCKGRKQLERYFINVLLVKNLKVGH